MTKGKAKVNEQFFRSILSVVLIVFCSQQSCHAVSSRVFSFLATFSSFDLKSNGNYLRSQISRASIQIQLQRVWMSMNTVVIVFSVEPKDEPIGFETHHTHRWHHCLTLATTTASLSIL